MAGAGGRGEGELLEEYRVSFFPDEKVLECVEQLCEYT